MLSREVHPHDETKPDDAQYAWGLTNGAIKTLDFTRIKAFSTRCCIKIHKLYGEFRVQKTCLLFINV